MIYGCAEVDGAECAEWVAVATSEPWLTPESALTVAGAVAGLWAVAVAGRLIARAILQSRYQ